MKKKQPIVTLTYRGGANDWEFSVTGRANWAKRMVKENVPKVSRLAAELRERKEKHESIMGRSGR